MTTHAHPGLASASSARRHRSVRHGQAAHWVLTGVLGAVLAAVLIAWTRVVSAVLADWSALTPFEVPIAWLVVGVATVLVAALGCLTAAAALWR